MFRAAILSISQYPVVGALHKLQVETPTPVIAAYGAFATVGFLVHHYVAEGAYSSVITMSAIVQCLGICFLCIKVATSRSAAGISARSLMLDALALAFRLSSTTWLNGYLPVDKSGDHVYQIMEACSLLMILWLLQRVLVVHRNSYEVSHDTFPVGNTAFVCLVLAVLLHADEDRRFLFDTLWMAALFTEVMAVLPQLWFATKSGGQVEVLTSHYIAALALSRVMSGMFMWAARNSINCKPWIFGINHSVIAILGAHVLHLLLIGDFAYYYVKSMLRSGVGQHVDLNLDGALV